MAIFRTKQREKHIPDGPLKLFTKISPEADVTYILRAIMCLCRIIFCSAPDYESISVYISEGFPYNHMLLVSIKIDGYPQHNCGCNGMQTY